MSPPTHAAAPGAASAHGAHHGAAGHGTRRTYLIGFALSVLLTAIPFWLVMAGAASAQVIAAAITTLAVVQIVVHMHYFLHMNAHAEGGWNLLALLFTLILVVITLAGSLWVMYHLNTNMMPSHMSMSEMP
jgi:cytochrome o ubiquinol oxidase operon protein cyoD